MRKQLVSGKKLVLFVDTGDNCRCPLAIGYLTKLLSQKNINYIELKHMGVMTPNDLLPTPEVVQLLKEEGVDIKYHRSRPVNDDLIRQADVVLGFTAIHVQTCLRRVPESKPKTFLLKDFVGLGQSGDQIHDPMGSTMEIFKKYFAEIKQSLQRLVEMEFITTPPEPKEVVIAPTVSKPRQTAQEDETSGPGDEARKARAKKPPKVEESTDRDDVEEIPEDAESPELEIAKPTGAKTKKGSPSKTEEKSAGKQKAFNTGPDDEPAPDKPGKTSVADKPAKTKETAKLSKATDGAAAKKSGVKAAAAKPVKKAGAKAEVAKPAAKAKKTTK